VGAELFHAERQRPRRRDRKTDMTKGIVAFLNFAKAPKKAFPNKYIFNSIMDKRT
jgi:hypothetical protein